MNMFRNGPSLAVFLVLGCVPLAASAAPGSRDDNVETESQTVSYADLDLTELKDNAVLYKRLVIAAERVCHTRDAHGLEDQALAQKCKQAAIDDAVMRINSTMLALINGGDAERSDVVYVKSHAAMARR